MHVRLFYGECYLKVDIETILLVHVLVRRYQRFNTFWKKNILNCFVIVFTNMIFVIINISLSLFSQHLIYKEFEICGDLLFHFIYFHFLSAW